MQATLTLVSMEGEAFVLHASAAAASRVLRSMLNYGSDLDVDTSTYTSTSTIQVSFQLPSALLRKAVAFLEILAGAPMPNIPKVSAM
jgi:hypothetical protein